MYVGLQVPQSNRAHKIMIKYNITANLIFKSTVKCEETKIK